ncbi:hypothetical protein C8F04DRAFT_55164 [Mycena alexandri]|uniref:Uncharacterized protein n=1 Tax=Mycena alexandri TaxID=1745969 RepID=A0AAD6XEZ0_9AGAR|nr:hypothetical protein C8F04DRAFT_55164 [Mycena alexandri]
MNSFWRVARINSIRSRHYSSRVEPNSFLVDRNSVHRLVEEELDPPRRQFPRISTLQPRKLQPGDFMETLPYGFHLFYRKPATPDLERSLTLQHRGGELAWTDALPPTPCRGFLYFHNPANRTAPLAATLRFRLTPDFSPASRISPQAAFAAGSDLQIPGADGFPWSMALWTLVKYPVFGHLCNVLRNEGARLPAHPWPGTRQMDEFSVMLYARGQPFLVDFSLPSLRVWLPQLSGPPLAARIEPGFVDLKNKKYRMPYTGLGIMALELLEDGRFGIQLLKILSLAKQYVNESVERPVEGMIRPLAYAPLLFKEAAKPGDSKFVGRKGSVAVALENLPHVSELPWYSQTKVNN